MSAPTAESVYEASVLKLCREEKQKLLDLIRHDLQSSDRNSFSEVWERIKSRRPYGYWNEDPQEWICRTRREADESRARALKGSDDGGPVS
jgi:hypothetical protein